ncbi:MAG: GTP-binding protein [Lachnospiraceae bacterium]|nr:GTP-binding protein [Lachnospiraceae bacterium]
MSETSDNLVLGLLAHVDAGKTTLSEAMLYLCGNIRKMGRVDNGDAYLDTDIQERERGITIFSKQALLSLGKKKAALLDTPGHVDFSAEMERTLQVLDYGILIINALDGVQGHTRTLWKLLTRYQIPTFIFINKMDRPEADRNKLLKELKETLDDRCVEFDGERMENWKPERMEQIALSDEVLMEKYLENGEFQTEDVQKMIKNRKLFPCYFGSALKLEAIDVFLKGLELYTKANSYGENFGAKVYKISRDEQGNRLTYMKITGGVLRVKERLGEDKINQIRIYSGKRYETAEEVRAGDVCAVLGPEGTRPGQGLGAEPDSELPLLEPVLTYQVLLPEDCNRNGILQKLKQMEEEAPELHVLWNEKTAEIQVQLMGEVQIDVLKRMIYERYGIRVGFGTGNIVYKETIAGTVEGVGHFEPLKHYAEVHLILEPGEPGSGLQFDTNVSEDSLDKNWQRLILTHLEEKQHKGVLTGSDITDMKITLAAGKAHLKHTEGGDFRQATYRAVRQGLMEAESILLEPYYEFRMEIPQESIGRAMTDIERMHGTCESPDTAGGMAVLTGTAPVSAMSGYQTEITSYTRGTGRIFCALKGYAPCRNPEEVIEKIGYHASGDMENPSSSVFCAHGAGFVVEWNEVKKYMHLESVLPDYLGDSGYPADEPDRSAVNRKQGRVSSSIVSDDELKAIFERTYGPVKQRETNRPKRVVFQPKETEYKGKSDKKNIEEYLLVDGYNVIYAWEDLRELAEVNMDAARDRLLDIMCNYQGYRQCNLIVVFDAYKVRGFQGEATRYHNIEVVFTKEAETADQYIEKLAHNFGRKYRVTVATSDGLEQIIIMGQGCSLLSSRELKLEVERLNQQIREEYLEKQEKNHNYLLDHADDLVRDYGNRS